jgi:hypothetical protein
LHYLSVDEITNSYKRGGVFFSSKRKFCLIQDLGVVVSSSIFSLKFESFLLGNFLSFSAFLQTLGHKLIFCVWKITMEPVCISKFLIKRNSRERRISFPSCLWTNVSNSLGYKFFGILKSGLKLSFCSLNSSLLSKIWILPLRAKRLLFSLLKEGVFRIWLRFDKGVIDPFIYDLVVLFFDEVLRLNFVKECFLVNLVSSNIYDYSLDLIYFVRVSWERDIFPYRFMDLLRTEGSFLGTLNASISLLSVRRFKNFCLTYVLNTFRNRVFNLFKNPVLGLKMKLRRFYCLFLFLRRSFGIFLCRKMKTEFYYLKSLIKKHFDVTLYGVSDF